METSLIYVALFIIISLYFKILHKIIYSYFFLLNAAICASIFEPISYALLFTKVFNIY